MTKWSAQKYYLTTVAYIKTLIYYLIELRQQTTSLTQHIATHLWILFIFFQHKCRRRSQFAAFSCPFIYSNISLFIMRDFNKLTQTIDWRNRQTKWLFKWLICQWLAAMLRQCVACCWCGMWQSVHFKVQCVCVFQWFCCIFVYFYLKYKNLMHISLLMKFSCQWQ